MVLLSFPDEAGRIARPDLARRHVLRYDRTGPDNGVLAYGHRFADYRTATDIGITLQVNPPAGIRPGAGFHEMGDDGAPDSHPHTVLYDDVLWIVGIKSYLLANKHFLRVLNFHPPF